MHQSFGKAVRDFAGSTMMCTSALPAASSAIGNEETDVRASLPDFRTG